MGYLAVRGSELALVRTRTGAFKKKISDEVLSRVPKREVASVELDQGKLLAHLKIEFGNGVTWQFNSMLLGWLTKWRAAGHESFLPWLRHQKASPVDQALAHAAELHNPVDTELLAHLEAFAVVFGQTPPPGAAVVLQPTLPPAIEQLRGAAQCGWPRVDAAIKSAARRRLVAFYQALDAPRRVLLRDWLLYLRYRASTPWPKDATDEEAKAARLVWELFRPHVAFLEWMLGAVASAESAVHDAGRRAKP